jgi:hypothetical protein
VNGQVHLVKENAGTHQYCDIVITKPTKRPIVFGSRRIRDTQSCPGASSYQDVLDADNAWVVHFTCEDEYHRHLTWQTKEQLEDDIDVVHI